MGGKKLLAVDEGQTGWDGSGDGNSEAAYEKWKVRKRFYQEQPIFWILEFNNKLAIDMCTWLIFPTLTCLKPLLVFDQKCFCNDPFFSK